MSIKRHRDDLPTWHIKPTLCNTRDSLGRIMAPVSDLPCPPCPAVKYKSMTTLHACLQAAANRKKNYEISTMFARVCVFFSKKQPSSSLLHIYPTQSSNFWQKLKQYQELSQQHPLVFNFNPQSCLSRPLFPLLCAARVK
jgi:hypothetical protein